MCDEKFNYNSLNMYKNYITYKLYTWNRPNLANIKQNVKNRVRTKD